MYKGYMCVGVCVWEDGEGWTFAGIGSFTIFIGGKHHSAHWRIVNVA